MGVPAAHGSLQLFPVFGEVAADRDYVLLDEAVADRTLTFAEKEPGGAVARVVTTNHGGRPALLPAGAVLAGARTNRMIAASLLIPPDASALIPVISIEPGRWFFQAGRGFLVPGRMGPVSLRANVCGQAAHSLEAGELAIDQLAVWQEIERLQTAHNTDSATDDALALYAARGPEFDQFSEKLRPEPGQVGMIAAVEGQIVSFEGFDRPETLTKMYAPLVASLALEAMVRQGQRRATPDEAAQFLSSLTGNLCPAPLPGIGQHWLLKGEGVVGGALIGKAGVVHAAAFRAT